MTDNNNNEMFVVQSDEPERLFVKVYHDFLDSKLLDRNEKMVFILLKRYLDFRSDKNGISGKVYPTLDILAEKCKMTKCSVIKTIKSLEEKKIISVERSNGYNKPNVYTIHDFKEMWQSETQEEITEKIKRYDIQKAIDLLKKEGIIKEKEPDTLQADQSDNVSSTQIKQFDIVNTTTEPKKSQESDKNATSVSKKNQKMERYTIEQIRQMFDYDIMMKDYHGFKEDIEAVFNILYDTLNCTKDTLRINKENKPTMIVISRIMKLDYSELIYAIEKYHEQKSRIKNVKSYLLTILYNAKDQHYLDVMNLGHHNKDF